MAQQNSDAEASAAARVTPAHVNFLTIYNPVLGDTEETEQDQIVIWVAKEDPGTKRKSRSSKTHHVGVQAGDGGDVTSVDDGDKLEGEQVHERLRHIGLARGMVEFAKNFAGEKPLDVVETDRSRIVLHELEPNWWILASVELTRLPATHKHSQTSSNPADGSIKQEQGKKLQHEYSNREVSPAALLRSQLIKAHDLFLIHHSASLWDLYHKLGRDHFSTLLNRFWERFVRQWWDVLLHGNPIVDVFGGCVRLARGGELGVGVGEEEWGSGEREVLEDFIERTEGCAEIIVGRYGAAPKSKPKPKSSNHESSRNSRRRRNSDKQEKTNADEEYEPWLGMGEDPAPADGIIFSGVGTISRRSLATVSQWMEGIYKHGESTYGISENPASRPRQRRKKQRAVRQPSEDPPKLRNGDQGGEWTTRYKSPRARAPDWRRKAIENNATPPGIPAPLVGTVERSLDEALSRVTERGGSRSPKSSPRSSPKSSPRSSPRVEKSQDEAMKAGSSTQEEASSVFSMEGMKSLFSFGYGSSWTLNPRGFEKEPDSKPATQEQSQGPANTIDESVDRPRRHRSVSAVDLKNSDHSLREGAAFFPARPPLQRSASSGKPALARLQELDPTPEVSEDESEAVYMQKLEQSIGRFLIGLSGDLENAEFEDNDEPSSPGGSEQASASQRIFLRTLTVELANAYHRRPRFGRNPTSTSNTSRQSKNSADSDSSLKAQERSDLKTSAAASIDGADSALRTEKMQVAVYVHQPFIFVFLFELHTANLTIPAFYRSIHHQLGPLQKPLLQRTDPTQVAARITSALHEKSSISVAAMKKHVDSGNPLYDLVYDPSHNTIRTSIPNIPKLTTAKTVIKRPSVVSGSWYTLGIPIGTSGASSTTKVDVAGSVVEHRVEPWTRLEALSVQIQMLNTFTATRDPHETERTAKTGRGWWVLWMKVASHGKESEEYNEAFLVRKAADPSGKLVSDNRSGSLGKFLLRDQSREVSDGSSAGNGSGATVTGAKGVSEGVGVDARKWVEGLLSLTQ